MPQNKLGIATGGTGRFLRCRQWMGYEKIGDDEG